MTQVSPQIGIGSGAWMGAAPEPRELRWQGVNPLKLRGLFVRVRSCVQDGPKLCSSTATDYPRPER